MTTPDYWQQATRELAANDAVLRRLIRKYRSMALNSRGDAFMTLTRAVVGQQISVKAADSVWRRLTETAGAITPQRLADTAETELRAAGLSGRKAGYLRDLAGHFLSGRLDPARWHALDDEALIAQLCTVKGIGRWTAEMFLIFYMARPDVLPVDDIGLQRAMSLHYHDGRPLSKLKLQKIAKLWTPWRSVATWYLWRSLDPVPVEY